MRVPIRALSAHSAAEFNILPGSWQHEFAMKAEGTVGAPTCFF
jgi:hypothetical protein